MVGYRGAMPTHARERLVEAAERLFYAEGIRAVGVEQLLTASGVGRASFYRHFESKDELVLTVLRRRDERWRRWLADRVASLGGHPLAVFDALAEDAGKEGFRGCAFLNAMTETADPDGPVHRLAMAHKSAVTAYVEGLLTAAGRTDAAALAPQFVLLMDGATVTSLRERGAEPAHRARGIAARLLAESAAG